MGLPVVRTAFGLLFCAAVTFPSPPVELPSLAPQITSVFPHGGRAGSTITVSIRGTNLDRASRFLFTRPGMHAEILSSEFRLIKARLSIANDAETGSHELRLFTPTGAATAVFQVSALREAEEIEPNDNPSTAQSITYPVLINGTADAADADYFRFQVRAGQTLTFDINAVRSGSALDPVLAILDDHGVELSYCDDYYTSKDAHIEQTFPRAGNYFVRVTASYERSARNAEYRLLITDRAYPMYALPAGGQRGHRVDVTIRGANLTEIDRAWLDTTRVPVSVLRRSAAELKIGLNVPAEFPPGPHRLHLGSGDQETAAQIRFDVSDLPEITLPDDIAAAKNRPQLLEAPVLVNAEVGAHGADYIARQHYFDFEAREGGRYEFIVNSWELGLRLDPVVALYDLTGNKLALEDDPAPNSFIHYAASHDPHLVYRFPKGGHYRLLVRDAMYRGGAGFIYRLTIRETQPDFSLDVHGAQMTAYVGRKTKILAQIHRTGGVHVVESFKHPDNEIENFRIQELDGWNTPVMVSIEGLPAGVTTETVAAEPRNTVFKGNDGEELFVDGTLVEAPIIVSAEAHPGLYPIRVRAEGRFEDRTVQRFGRVLHTMRGLRGVPVEDGELYLAVVQPPPVLMTPPANAELTKGESGHLKVGLYYFEPPPPSVTIEAREPCPGVSVSSLTRKDSGPEVELPIRAAETAPDAECQLVLLTKESTSGRVLAQSPPVSIKISGRKSAKAE